MAALEPQQTDHFLGGSFSRSVPSQRHHHALRDVGILSAASNGQLNGRWEPEGVPSALRNGAISVQGELRDPRHVNMNLEEYRPLPDDPAVPNMYPQIGRDHGALEHERVMFPENQGNGTFGYVPQGTVRDLAQAAVPGPSVHQYFGLREGEPAGEDLRRLASRYLLHPDSQIDMVRLEPGSGGRYKVVIVLEMAELP